MKKHFIVKQNEDYGLLGLTPINGQYQDPLEGMTIAHDLLEHFNFGEIHHEFEALGAAIWIRGNGGYFQNHYNPNHLEHIASDYTNIINWANQYSKSLKPCTRKIKCPELSEDMEHLTQIVFDSEEFKESNLTKDWIVSSTHWMTNGYVKAPKKYSPYCSYYMTSVFQQIEKYVDTFLKNASEGMEIILSFKNGEFIPKPLQDY